MSDLPPAIRVPVGFHVVTTTNGYEVVSNGETFKRTVAFRLPASMYADLEDLINTFPERSWGAAMRWLVTDPTVQEVIKTRVCGMTRRAM